jgi:hypothetical protein
VAHRIALQLSAKVSGQQASDSSIQSAFNDGDNDADNTLSVSEAASALQTLSGKYISESTVESACSSCGVSTSREMDREWPLLPGLRLEEENHSTDRRRSGRVQVDCPTSGEHWRLVTCQACKFLAERTSASSAKLAAAAKEASKLLFLIYSHSRFTSLQSLRHI